MNAPLVLIVFPVLVGLYLLPALIARHRRHHNALAIGVLNILFGWTLLGWAAALIWALTNTAASREEPAGRPRRRGGFIRWA